MDYLETFVFDKLSETNLPGLSLALVKGGEVVYARGFGQRDVERGLPATPETLYCVGSVTKSLTALAVLQLAERGLLDLQDPVERYLPFPFRPKGETVRLEHLLAHTAGLPALAYSEALIRHAHDIGGRWLPIAGPEDVLTFMAGAEDWIETRPGARWFYFNEGYALLGLIVQRLSGKSYHDYVRDEILRPLGMTRSFFTKEEIEGDRDVAVPYVVFKDGRREPGRYLYRTIRSEGGLVSNVLDLSRYLGMFLAGGQGIVSARSLEAMMQPRVAGPFETAPELWGLEAPPKPDTHYGFGLTVQPDFYGEPLFGHGGSVLVSTAHLAFLPKSGLGVMVLANGSGYSLGQLAQVALALMMERDPDTLPFMRVEKGLKALTGHYETYRKTMQAEVSRQGDFLKLTLYDRAQPQEITLVPERLGGPETTFFTLLGGRRLTVRFREGEKGTELLYERYKLRRVAHKS